VLDSFWGVIDQRLAVYGGLPNRRTIGKTRIAWIDLDVLGNAKIGFTASESVYQPTRPAVRFKMGGCTSSESEPWLQRQIGSKPRTAATAETKGCRLTFHHAFDSQPICRLR
jgi:hypothetical protein